MPKAIQRTWTPEALEEKAEIRRRCKFPFELSDKSLSAKRFTEMRKYAMRLEDEILKLKGICKYMEIECEARPIQKVTRTRKSAL